MRAYGLYSHIYVAKQDLAAKIARQTERPWDEIISRTAKNRHLGLEVGISMRSVPQEKDICSRTHNRLGCLSRDGKGRPTR